MKRGKKKPQQRWPEERVWKTEDCAEAADLASGLVAAVIILMLVVKLLWVDGGRGGGGGGGGGGGSPL